MICLSSAQVLACSHRLHHLDPPTEDRHHHGHRHESQDEQGQKRSWRGRTTMESARGFSAASEKELSQRLDTMELIERNYQNIFIWYLFIYVDFLEILGIYIYIGISSKITSNLHPKIRLRWSPVAKALHQHWDAFFDAGDHGWGMQDLTSKVRQLHGFIERPDGQKSDRNLCKGQRATGRNGAASSIHLPVKRKPLYVMIHVMIHDCN